MDVFETVFKNCEKDELNINEDTSSACGDLAVRLKESVDGEYKNLGSTLSEGKVPSESDSEDVKIDKLTEQDEEDLDIEKDIEADYEDEEVSYEDEEAPEIEKEYVGRTEDTHFYLVSTEDGEDLQIVDQEGEVKYSAKENDLDPSAVDDFLIQAIQDVEIDEIERSIFMKYILPKLVEEEEQEEEEEELPVEEPEEEMPEPEQRRPRVEGA